MIAIMSLLFLVHRWSTVTDEKISNVVTCVHVLSGSGKSRTAAGLCAKALPDITVGYIYMYYHCTHCFLYAIWQSLDLADLPVSFRSVHSACARAQYTHARARAHTHTHTTHTHMRTRMHVHTHDITCMKTWHVHAQSQTGSWACAQMQAYTHMNMHAHQQRTHVFPQRGTSICTSMNSDSRCPLSPLGCLLVPKPWHWSCCSSRSSLPWSLGPCSSLSSSSSTDCNLPCSSTTQCVSTLMVSEQLVDQVLMPNGQGCAWNGHIGCM